MVKGLYGLASNKNRQNIFSHLEELDATGHDAKEIVTWIQTKEHSDSIIACQNAGRTKMYNVRPQNRRQHSQLEWFLTFSFIRQEHDEISCDGGETCSPNTNHMPASSCNLAIRSFYLQ